MHRWTPLNDHQLALLTRIGAGSDPVTSDSPGLALTARALKERGLITMPKEGGRWQAEVSDAGRFYLQHGHHPDRPEPAPRRSRTKAAATATTQESEPPEPKNPAEPKTRVQRAPKVAQPSPADIGAALIAEVQQAGRFLHIPDPGEAERARYRRAFDAARQCPPAGYHLKYTGRAKGDISFGLLRVNGEDDTEWNRIRLARSRTLTDVDDVIAAVEKDHSAFEVSEEVLPRVLSLLRLLAERAFALHGEITVSRKRKQPRPVLTVHDITCEISFRERQRQVPYVPKQPGRRTYDWQRVTPAHRFEPSGELELRLGIKREWADANERPLEDQIDEVFKVLKARGQEQERARLKYEAEQRRLREERDAEQHRLQEERARQEADRQRAEAEKRQRTQEKWETAVSVASIKAVDAARAEQFGTALDQWRAVGEIRAFCDVLDEAASQADDPAEAESLREWSAWGRSEADGLDPVLSRRGLRGRNFHAEPTGDQLRPFLDGWHPHRPKKEKPPAEPAPAQPEARREPERSRAFSDERLDQGWRYGRPGRAQWWRR
ncbi:PE-PGRS family protein [Streptomyces sp. NPDC059564]|uniref:PE-PGRS family protein n=1 Tax=Streptomyces sp. NPDC059564 TaxID=3346865 RepID=UPI0036BAB90B